MIPRHAAAAAGRAPASVTVELNEPAFPYEGDDFVGTLAMLLMERCCPNEVGFLLHGRVEILQTDYDNWDGGMYGWTVMVTLPTRIYARLEEEDRTNSERMLTESARELLNARVGHFVAEAKIIPLAAPPAGWRDVARRFLNAEGISNQGRVRSDNVATVEADGLLFRSQPEVILYHALKSRGIVLAPLPVFLRGGAKYQRIEPDFILLKDGLVVVLEIDGEGFHRESPAEAEARVRMFKEEGAYIERIPASECDTQAKANKAADQIVKLFEKLRRLR